MPKMLTDAAVRAAEIPPSGTVALWDGSLKNFGVRVGRGGTKTFIVLIGSGRRHSIGRYPHISVADARKEAKRILAEKELGQIRPTHKPFDDAKADFFNDIEGRVKPRTLSDYRRLLDRHYRFKRKSIADIKPIEIMRLLNALSSTPSERHHAFSAGTVFFNWCVRQQLVEQSPMGRLAVPAKRSSRERVLNDDELRVLLAALSASGRLASAS